MKIGHNFTIALNEVMPSFSKAPKLFKELITYFLPKKNRKTTNTAKYRSNNMPHHHIPSFNFCNGAEENMKRRTKANFCQRNKSSV